MRKNLKGFKKALAGFLSVFTLLTIGWLVFFGKGKVSELISPLINKIPKDESKLSEFTDKVLGKTIKQLNQDKLRKITEKSSEFLESSQYAQPAREIRENFLKRADEIIESIKELPAEEIRVIKQQVCKQWLEEVATSSAEH